MNFMILELLDCSGRVMIIYNVFGIDEFCLFFELFNGWDLLLKIFVYFWNVSLLKVNV